MTDFQVQNTTQLEADLKTEDVVVFTNESKSVEKNSSIPESKEENLNPNPKVSSDDVKIDEFSSSFNEESTKVSDLPDAELKSLQELKQLVQEALNNHDLLTDRAVKAIEEPETESKNEEQKEDVEVDTEKEEKKSVDEESKLNPDVDETSKQDPEVVGDETEEINQHEKDEHKVTDEKTFLVSDSLTDDDVAKTVEETIKAVSTSQLDDRTPLEDAVEKIKEVKTEEVSIYGIPLLADERSNVILLKFLRARDFKVKDAFAMLKNTLRWRKEFGIDELVDEDLGDDDLNKVVFMNGFDKEGHPVCYNVYGEFQNKELYQKTFSDEEKRLNFLKWRIQFLEKSIKKLDFGSGGISTIVQVNDLKNSPGPGKWELRQATKQALQLLQDNYPEFVAKQVFINVPWWYLAVNKMISPFLTQRTRSKFVFAGPSKSAETLLRYITAEQIPVKYGGLSKDGDFDTTDAVTEITVKPAARHTVEFPVTEACVLIWEVRVVGWDVKYGAEFVPNGEESYTVIIQKAKKVSSNEEPVVSNSFNIGEPGKLVLTIDNSSSKKKKLLYRLKTKPSSSSSDLIKK